MCFFAGMLLSVMFSFHVSHSAASIVKTIQPEPPQKPPKKAPDANAITLESKMGRKAMNNQALINATAVPAPLSDELLGSLRSLKVRGP